MTNLIKVEGIGEVYAGKLAAKGISTAEELLEKGASPQGRKKIAEETGISAKLLLEWINHVDLFRIKRVSEAKSTPTCWKLPAWTRFPSWPSETRRTCTRNWSRSMTRRSWCAGCLPTIRSKSGSSKPRNCLEPSPTRRGLGSRYLPGQQRVDAAGAPARVCLERRSDSCREARSDGGAGNHRAALARQTRP